VSRSQDDLYTQAIEAYGAALHRLVRAYELDTDKRRDLLQEIHLALWRSLEKFEGRCSLRTWVYRVAHNTAASYDIRQRRTNSHVLLALEDIDDNDSAPDPAGGWAGNSTDQMALERLLELIYKLKPPDRQLMLLYLEDLDAATIGEITGISAGNVRVQIHRIKAILARRFHSGGQA
jgi:RNA polymerase sigma-70 factor (ECF subfamily)